MTSQKVGRVKNVSINPETGDVELTIAITDSKFKKQLIRDLSLSGNLRIEGEALIFESMENE